MADAREGTLLLTDANTIEGSSDISSLDDMANAQEGHSLLTVATTTKRSPNVTCAFNMADKPDTQRNNEKTDAAAIDLNVAYIQEGPLLLTDANTIDGSSDISSLVDMANAQEGPLIFTDANTGGGSSEVISVGDMTNAQEEPLLLTDANTGDGNSEVISVVDMDITQDVSGSLIGMTGETMEEMYSLYCKHSRAVGFSVRKSTTRQSTKGDGLKEKYFVCSCSGFKETGKVTSTVMSRKAKANTRTGCQASLRIKRNAEGLYEVIHHVIQHNHPLSRNEWTHFHRSEREITKEKAKLIEDMISSGMGAMDSFRYMTYDAGGEECVGHTTKDHLNFVNRIKMKAVEGGDAQKVVDMLISRSAEEQNFFFRVKFDDEGRFCSVFWRDTMMFEDYQLFGDVVVFDTTYRTNKYDLICGPFVGVNNHRKNTMFACAFLANETIESFKWLFEVFKESMENQCPKTFFTDQDHAIANAVQQVFPTTRHRLCLWHLHQKAVSHFGQLKRDKSFNDAFHKCLSGCDTEKEFEDNWRSTMETYGLEDNLWFKRLYTLKNKWCTALNKDFFSAGLLSSQRSESTNHALGFKAKKTTSLTQFFDIFNDMVTRWRNNEKSDEYQCSRKVPPSVIPLTGLLGHASKVYTLRLFQDFQAEFMKCINAHTTLIRIENNSMLYDISFEKGDVAHHVTNELMDKVMTCSCKKFEEVGILCYHCLRVLNINSVCEIPDHYILKRWTKVAKCELWDKFDKDKDGLGYKTKDGVPWRHQMARKYYNLILQCQESEEARKILEESYSRVMAAIDGLVASSNTATQVEQPFVTNKVLDPERVVTKGRRKRIKGPMNKKKKKKIGDTSSGEHIKEYGSITPVRLF